MRIRKLLIVTALVCSSPLLLVGCASTYAVSRTPQPAVHGFDPTAVQPNGSHPAFTCLSDGDCLTRPYCGSGAKCVSGLCSYQPMGTGPGYACDCFVGQEDFCPLSQTQLGISKCTYVSPQVTNVTPCASPGNVP